MRAHVRWHAFSRALCSSVPILLLLVSCSAKEIRDDMYVSVVKVHKLKDMVLWELYQKVDAAISSEDDSALSRLDWYIEHVEDACRPIKEVGTKKSGYVGFGTRPVSTHMKMAAYDNLYECQCALKQALQSHFFSPDDPLVTEFDMSRRVCKFDRSRD